MAKSNDRKSFKLNHHSYDLNLFLQPLWGKKKVKGVSSASMVTFVDVCMYLQNKTEQSITVFQHMCKQITDAKEFLQDLNQYKTKVPY